MKIVQRSAAILVTAAAALALGAGAASAGPVLPIIGDPQEVVETGLSTREGCKYPGFLVIAVAQVSPDEVQGCGYFERDPAFNDEG